MTSQQSTPTSVAGAERSSFSVPKKVSATLKQNRSPRQPRSSIHILVLGDEGVGKSSLISTFVSRHFSDGVPGIMTRVRLPPDPQSNCTTTIVDSQHGDAAIMAAITSASAQRVESQETKQRDVADDPSVSSTLSSSTVGTIRTASSASSILGLGKVDAIVLVYDVSRDDTFTRLENHWLPLIERCYDGDLPVIVAGNKTDIIQTSQLRQGEVAAAGNAVNQQQQQQQHQQIARSRQQIVSLMQRFRFVRQYIRCSAKGILHVDELFLKAQQAVLYPIGPLYNLEEGRLSVQCQRAFQRIFRIYDVDHDGLLSHAELDSFQYEAFRLPMYKRDLTGWRKVIQNNNSTEEEVVRDGKLTVAGFLAIFDVFVSQNRLEVPWQVLRKFGYDDDLQLIIPAPPVARDAATAHWSLSNSDRRFLIDLFQQFDSDNDGILSPDDVQEICSVLPPPAIPLWHPVRTLEAFKDAFSLPKLPPKPLSSVASESSGDEQSATHVIALTESLSASGITIASGESLPTINMSSIHRSSFPISESLSFLDWMAMWHMSTAISPEQTRAELFRLGHLETWRRGKRKRPRKKGVHSPTSAASMDMLLPSREIRVLVFGSPGSGKTAMLNSLCGVKDALYTSKTRQPETSSAYVKLERRAKSKKGQKGSSMEHFVVHIIFTEVPEAEAEDQAQRKRALADILSGQGCDLVMLTFDSTNSASLAYVKHLESSLLSDEIPRMYIATKSDQMQSIVEGQQEITVVDEAVMHCQETELERPLVTSASDSTKQAEATEIDAKRTKVLEHLAKCCLDEAGMDRKQSRPYEEKKRRETSRRRARKMIWLGVGVGVAVAVVGYLWTGAASKGAERKTGPNRFGWFRNWFSRPVQSGTRTS